MTTSLQFEYDDGGRALAGFDRVAGDCVARSIAIATGRPYREVYDRLAEGNGAARRKSKHHPVRGRTAGRGIEADRKWFKDYMAEIGFEWVRTMRGNRFTAHLNAEELPTDRTIIARTHRHFSAIVDGVLRDAWNPGRNETACVYGYWQKISENK